MRLKKLREQHGLTHAEIANAIGTDPQTIVDIENGTSIPTIAQTVKLANLFRCTTDFLLSSSENETETSPTLAPQSQSAPKHEKSVCSSENETESKADRFIGRLFITISFITIILIVVFLGTTIFSKNDETKKQSPALLSRAATTNDITIDTQYSFPVSIDLIIRPNCDISNLELTLKHYDEEGNLLKTQVKQVGNVSEGHEYTVEVSLTEFSLSTIWNIDSTKYGVTGGTVSYLK